MRKTLLVAMATCALGAHAGIPAEYVPIASQGVYFDDPISDVDAAAAKEKKPKSMKVRGRGMMDEFGCSTVGLSGLGLWRGKVTYTGTARGDIEYEGSGRVCAAMGRGTVRYPDGAVYEGQVTTYIRPPKLSVFEDFEPAVREGDGELRLPDGTRLIGRWGRDALLEGGRLMRPDGTTVAGLYGEVDQVLARAGGAATTAPTSAAAPASPAALLAAAAAPSSPGGAMSSGPQALPAPIARLAGVERLALALERYGATDAPIGRNDWAQGLFSPKCVAPAGGEARWDHGTAAYVGEHDQCYPRGLGRYRTADGADLRRLQPERLDGAAPRTDASRAIWWIGEFAPLKLNGDRVFGAARVQGLVERRNPDGTREFMELGYTPAPAEAPQDPGRRRILRALGIASPNGDVVVFDQRGEWSVGSEGSSLASLELDGTLYASSGWTLTGRFRGSKPVGDRMVARSPDGNVEVAGSLASGTAWAGSLDIVLRTDFQSLPSGRYRYMARDAVAPYSKVLDRWARFEPTDFATVQRSKRPAECTASPDLVPAGWAVWWPGCRRVEAQREEGGPKFPAQNLVLFSPDLRSLLWYVVYDDGSHGRRFLQTKDPRTGLTYVWMARDLRPTANTLEIVGEGQLRVRDENGATSLDYNGAFAGLQPNGAGRCERPAAEGGGREDCTFVAGKRTDANQALREQRALLAAQQAELERRRAEVQWEREQREEARRQEEAERLAEEEQLAEQQRRDAEEEDDGGTTGSGNAYVDAFAAVMNQYAAEQGARNAAMAEEVERKKADNAAALAAQREAREQQARDSAAAAAAADARQRAEDARLAAQQESLRQQQESLRVAGTSASAGVYSGSPSSATALPKVDSAKQVRCSNLSREIMAASNDFHCNLDSNAYATLGAWRDAERACRAAIDAKVAPLKAQYQNECGANTTGGAVGQ